MDVAGKYAAIYIGDKIGGPIGAILGDMIGEKINRKINNKFGQTTFDTPQMKTAMSILAKEEPRVYEFLDKAMKHYGIKIEPVEKEGSDVEEIIKDEKTSSLFKEGTPLDNTLEKLHQTAIKKGSGHPIQEKTQRGKTNKIATSGVFHNPRHRKGLLPPKAMGTSREGLIR
jgi:hypothetical protein